MSNKIAKKTQSFFVKALLLLLILSFGLWGIGDMVSPALQGGSVATVADKEVSAQRVYQDVQRELQRMRQATGQADIEETLGNLVANSVVERAVNAALLEVSAEDMDVAISDKLVRQAIRTNQIFQDESGAFSRARFDQVMFSSNLTETQFIELVRADIAREQVLSILLNGVQMPRTTTEALFRHLEEQRIVDFVTINSNDLILSQTPDLGAVEQYYTDNQNQFMAPQYRRVSLLHVTPADLADSIEVPLEDIENAYSQRLNEFRVPEQRAISQMVFETEEAAQGAILEVEGGKSFVDVAQDSLGLDAASIELGTLERSALPEELQAPAFELALGALSQPVQSLLGWHVLTVTEISGGQTTSFEDAEEQLRTDLALLMAAEELFDLSNQVEDTLGGGATIEEAAQSIGRDLISITGVDAQGLDQQGNPVAALEGFPVILQEVFATTLDTEPQMRDDAQSGYFLVRVDEIIESQPRPFDTIQDQVARALEASLKADQARTLATEIVQTLEGSTSLSEVATEKGLIVQTSEAFSRATTPFEEDLTRDIFAGANGAVLSAPMQNGHVVAVLKEVVPFTQASGNIGLNNLENQLNASLANDLQGQLVDALRRDYPVSINQNMIAAILAPQGQN